MANQQHIEPNAENPEKFLGLKLTKPKQVAAGIPAVLSSARHVFGEMDLARGIKALMALNQKDGYDCPGCAWPDPDDERSSLGEYCENGIKAIAEEAQKKKLTAGFFKKHSVEEIGSWTDFEIGKQGRLTQPMILHKGAIHYQPLPWEDAFEIIANEIKNLSTPDEAVFYTSG